MGSHIYTGFYSKDYVYYYLTLYNINFLTSGADTIPCSKYHVLYFLTKCIIYILGNDYKV